ncbi:F-box/LRR-repeat protein 2 [Lutzomyia longipalpis]|uniref:F-box/LRR-repeat protein 2 n=1 Tax=Lutzomyia longipalpis TaxID=7200 RepID=UPI002483DB1D|nr:F-box/LRR-repeat protein 2 [Lutzomyia longipalpis]
MDSQHKSILILNHDCLLSIFSYLDIREVITMEEVCTKFRTIAEMSYPSFRELNYDELAEAEDEPIPLQLAKQIAKRVGPYARVLVVSKSSFRMKGNAIPLSVLNYFTNLEGIQFTEFDILTRPSLKRFTEIFKTIQHVSLERCNYTDSIGMCFTNATQLEFLQLNGNKNLTGVCLQSLRGLTKLKHVDLSECASLEPGYFAEFCRNNPQLQSLSIVGCDTLNESSLSTIATIVLNVNALGISDHYHGANDSSFEKLANLPKLTKIDVKYSFPRDYDNLRLFWAKMHHRLEWIMIISHLKVFRKDFYESTLKELRYFTKLEALKLYHMNNCNDSTLATLSCNNTLKKLCVVDCCSVSPRGLREFIMKCPSLDYINLSQNPQYGDEFLIDLEIHLKDRPGLLELCVNDTPIHEYIKSDSKRAFIAQFYFNNKGRIELSWHPPSSREPPVSIVPQVLRMFEMELNECSVC